MMRVSDLDKFSIPSRIIDIWRRRYGESLLPVQRRAIRKGLLGSDGGVPSSLIISAPTSSGKSFCAEMAAVQALTRRQRAVMIFPLKSLAEEKYRLLNETYQPLGIKCLIATGDHPENDRAFCEGDYHLAIAVYEKLDLLLTTHLDALKNTGCLVIDELQMIAEKGRGALLERLLTRITASEYNPAIIGLSAVVGDEAAENLAGWLGCEVVEETARPVDLVRGVAATGILQFRSYNSGEEGSEPFIRFERGDDAVDTFMQQLKKETGPTLVFVKSRMDTVNLAFRLASVVNWPAAKDAVEKLRQEEPTYLIRSLRQALGKGVAFHNSDLSCEQRIIVEQAFIDKSVKAIFSTTTLAMGVNLPAETVYLETVKYDSGTYDDRPELVPVSRAEFDNMTGRAGRLGLANDKPGRAIVMAESLFDRDVLWEQYIAPVESRTIDSAFNSLSLEDWLLSMIVSRLVRKREDADRVFACTYQSVIVPGTVPDFDSAVANLQNSRLVSSDEIGNLDATERGKAIATTGLKVCQAQSLCEGLKWQYPESKLGWIALALSVPGWTLPPGILSRSEQADNEPVKLLFQRFDHAVGEIACIIGDDPHRRPLSFRQAATLKALMLLDDWSRLVPVQRLEESYQMHLGQIRTLGETAAHLLSSLGALIKATDRESAVPDALDNYAFSLRHGLPAELRAIHQGLDTVLNRSDYVALQKAGISNLIDLAKISQEELQQILEGETKLKSINNKLSLLKEEVAMSAAQLASSPMAVVEPELIEVDGTFDRERYLVKIDGFPVRLTGKSFKYFTKLAWSRLNRDSGWVYKEDIEIGFNQARYLYRMKNEIKAGLKSCWPVLENNRLGYYRLRISPDKIKININNLRDFPDIEVQGLINPGHLMEPEVQSVGLQ